MLGDNYLTHSVEIVLNGSYVTVRFMHTWRRRGGIEVALNSPLWQVAWSEVIWSAWTTSPLGVATWRVLWRINFLFRRKCSGSFGIYSELVVNESEDARKWKAPHPFRGDPMDEFIFFYLSLKLLVICFQSIFLCLQNVLIIVHFVSVMDLTVSKYTHNVALKQSSNNNTEN